MLQYLEGKAQLLYPEPADVFPVSCRSAINLSMCPAADNFTCQSCRSCIVRQHCHNRVPGAVMLMQLVCWRSVT